MKIPFFFKLANWTLKGADLEKAKAKHTLTGKELDRTLLNIEFPDYTVRHLNQDYKLKDLELRYKYGEIEAKEYDVRKLDIMNPNQDSLDYKLALLDLRLIHKDVTELEYRKQKATLNNEPFVEILEANLSYKKEGSGIDIGLEWNDLFIEELIKNGYHADTQEEVAQLWFRAVCHDIFLEEMIDEDFNSSMINKIKTDNGTEYS